MVGAARSLFYLLPFWWLLALALPTGGCMSDPEPLRSQGVQLRTDSGRYRLYRNGQPFRIQGASGYTHLDALKAAGGNTLRTWDTTNLGPLLDEAHRHGLAVIVGLPMPESAYMDVFYDHREKVQRQYEAFRQLVRRHRQHPALLLWGLGNELDFPFRARFDGFYAAFNDLIDMIHREDPAHPVTTTLTNFQSRSIYNLRLKVPALDLISINTFGRIRQLRTQLRTFSWFWNGPYLLTEWGGNGYWESDSTAWGAPVENSSTRKAELLAETYRTHLPDEDPRFLGALVFYWGEKQEATPTWYSLFCGPAATAAIPAMEALWTGRPLEKKAPEVEYMLVNGKGGRDNVLLKPGAEAAADLLLRPGQDTALTYTWKILPEDWYVLNRNRRSEPPAIPGLLKDSNSARVRFTAPQQEGPYRIYVTVFNQQGYCATANTPFYVVN